MRTLITLIASIAFLTSCTSTKQIARPSTLTWEAYCEQYLNKPSDQTTEEEVNYFLDVFCETDEYIELYESINNYN